MKFHIQRHLHKAEESSGSCYPTVYACLLDYELDRVPHFNLAYWHKQNIAKYLQNRFLEGKSISEFEGPEHQKENFHNHVSIADWCWENFRLFWLAANGYTEETIKDIDQWLKDNPDTPYMASGKSSRGIDHIVIYMNGKLYHDPHPSGEGLVEIWKTHPYSYLKKI
jgi:hypothetical protein